MCVCVGGGSEGTAGSQRETSQTLPELTERQPGKFDLFSNQDGGVIHPQVATPT